MSGGRRPGSGRPKGSRGAKTKDHLDAVKASGTTPLAYMLQVMRNEAEERSVRLDAAKSAAPYVHPKLANIELGEDPNKPFKGKFPIVANA